MDEKTNFKQLPLVVLRGKVLFPDNNASFDVSRIKSLTAIGKSIDFTNQIFVVSQKDATIDAPRRDDLFDMGVVCRVKKISQLSGTNLRVYVETLYRAEIKAMNDVGDYYSVDFAELPDVSLDKLEETRLLDYYKGVISDYADSNIKFSREILDIVCSINEPSKFINILVFNLPLSEKEKQDILEETVISKRFQMIEAGIGRLTIKAQIEKDIADDVKESVDKSQREYYLREQLKAVHKELGDDDNEIENIRESIQSSKMPQEVKEKGLKELERMTRMNSSSPDYTVLRSYLDILLELPFGKKSKDTSDLNKAISILESDHFGLEKVKERIIEYIAVLKVTHKLSSAIICLVGPPGVGKTSVATSIARALNRKFVRMSLGGVKDEAEIRGHRKTYIGAMPGRIINGMKEVGVTNPVFLLDEIDKMSMDLRGDPASALLEVLDPEQNKTFRDRYMEIPYDLSNVLFITTANSVETIPAPLLDRMELIQLDGYTQEEKIEISKRYLIPKRMKINGLDNDKISFDDEAISTIITGYTMEAGVRNLERQIDGICRKVTTELAKNEKFEARKITAETVKNYLGVQKISKDEAEKEDLIGASNGLAWTSYGGTTLTIEVAVVKGKGDVILTGKLGDVMKESARTALTYIHSKAEEYHISEDKFTGYDVHVHVPEGATPKDGPSAGITLATAILSAFSGKKVRHDVAMTGEITLRGNVLPIGGLKEKSLSAYRMGIYNIIIPNDNKKDVEDVPENIRSKMNFIPVRTAEEAFKNAFREF